MPYIKQQDRPKIDYYLRPLISFLISGSDDPDGVVLKGYIIELSEVIKTVGDLNYSISTVIAELFNENKKYQTANDLLDVLEEVKFRFVGLNVATSPLGNVFYELVSRLHNLYELDGIKGTLSAIKLEFYTRFVRPYEDEKIQENGDII